MSGELHKPGEDNQLPGEYIERGPRGGVVDDARQVTIDWGDRLPPTQDSGHTWERIWWFPEALALGFVRGQSLPM